MRADLRSILRAAVLASLLAGLAGCGGKSEAPATPAASAPASLAASARTGVIRIKGFAFSPELLEVAPKTKLTWRNEDGSLHTVTSGTPGSPDRKFGSKDFGLGADKTFTFTFSTPGTYHYFCTRHEFMKGTVVVG